MSDKLSTSNSTIIKNIESRIKILEKEKAAIDRDIQSETIPSIKEIYIQEKLTPIINELDSLETELSELRNEKRQNLRKQIGNIITNHGITDNCKKSYFAYIATADKYIIIENVSKNSDRVNISISDDLNAQKVVSVLHNICGQPGAFNDLSVVDIRTIFERSGCSYNIRTASFDSNRWDPGRVFNTLEIYRKFWVTPIEDQPYNQHFDDLIYAICGGKQENIDHLEQWIAYKYCYPNKAKITPSINITGRPGGNGKGMLTLILTTIFTDRTVGFVRSKNIVGGFNSILRDKVIGILDDEKKENFPQSELKQTVGNGSIVIEPKGVDAFSVDSTASMLVLDNVGLVKLVGGGRSGEDRRWSIIFTELSLLEHLEQKYSIDSEQSKQLAEEMANRIFESRAECGKWLAHLIKKHNVLQMPVLLPLHGADYQNRLLEQKDKYTEIFERLLPVVVEQGFIPFKILRNIVEVVNDERIKSPNTLSAKFDEFLSRNGHKNVLRGEPHWWVTWGNNTYSRPIKLRSSCRHLRADAVEFDYSRVSTVPYIENEPITRDTLRIHDYSVAVVEEEELPQEELQDDWVPKSTEEVLQDLKSRIKKNSVNH